jgi:hypothetical protein
MQRTDIISDLSTDTDTDTSRVCDKLSEDKIDDTRENIEEFYNS